MSTLRVATYNIHKGVQGLGLAKRLEIHNLAPAIQSLDADLVCLQEVRQFNRREARRFAHWPVQAQADFLAPPGYHAVYRTNAITRHGEHGNALLSRWPVLACEHRDISDHRLEQRGFLHVTLSVHGQALHVLVVHLGLIRRSRMRQLASLQHYIQTNLAPDAPLVLAGDFNEWRSGFAAGAEPADGGPVGQAAEDPQGAAVCRHPDLRHRGCVWHAPELVRPVRDVRAGPGGRGPAPL